ncbi:MAG: HAD-IIIA family hydrolase [Sphingobium sp.]|nr:HAD-IIIA family hydrolase [Sphingobium sp.]
MVQAVILAGGKGTRLASRLNGKPKPLVDVDGVPLLKRQIDNLMANGVDDIVLLVNHAANQIEAFIAEQNFACAVTLIDDGDPRGTAGAALACLDRLQDRFVVVYGDTLFDVDITHMIDIHIKSGAHGTLLLHPNDHPHDSDLVEISEEGWITAFHSYPHNPGWYLRNLVNAALYVIDKKCLTGWVDRIPVGDFAKDLFPAMLTEGALLQGYVSFEYIKDVGTPTRLDKAEGHLRRGVVERARRRYPQKAVFLDRDGTLNQLTDYVRKPDDLVLFEDAGAAVHRLNDAEYRVVVVTNQPVLARGECDVAGLAQIHAKLESELGDAGAFLDAIYYCPHHPHKGYAGEVPELKIDCACRKPGMLMIEQAVTALNIDLARSWMVGDSTADIAMAGKAGIRSVLVRTGEGGRDGKWPAAPDFTAGSLAEAVDIILANQQSAGTLAISETIQQ